MADVSFIHRWTLHLSKTEDEWEALCNVRKPEFLVDKPLSALPGYDICKKCLIRYNDLKKNAV
jgi:hypothetical protein